MRATSNGQNPFVRIGLALLASYSQAMANAPLSSTDVNYLARRTAARVRNSGHMLVEYMRNAMQVRKVEHILLMIGLGFLAVWTAARFHQVVGSRSAIASFEAEANRLGNAVSPFQDPDLDSPIDLSLWSPGRISAYKDSLARKSETPIAILRIPKIHLEVPVFNDTDDLTLNRGVGRILGTAQIGKRGNLGVAGHRDGFFRGLQNILPDDLIEIVRPNHVIDTYAVHVIRIVAPEDIEVLNPTAEQTLTLVTCFPFYFVGHAPKRYIVTAVLASTGKSDLRDDRVGTFKGRNISN